MTQETAFIGKVDRGWTLSRELTVADVLLLVGVELGAGCVQ